VKKLLLAVALFACTLAQAQAPYPNRPIKFIVPFPPGGNLDFIARIVAPKLSEALGQPVVIENKGGAGGIVGAEYAAKQPNDGYTIFLGNTGTLAVYAATYSTLPYDPIKDFTGVGMTSTNAMLAVIHPSVPASNVKEFVAYAKANPGKVAAGLAGAGSTPHFATEQLRSQAGIDMLMVPYKGGGPTVTDLVGGQIQLMVEAPTVSFSFVKAGRLKAIAVTGNQRLASLPDVPTFAEAGYPGVDATGWQAIVVPAGTPPAVIAKLSEALAKIINSAEVKEKFSAQGLDAASSTADELNAHIRSEVPKWTRLAKAANIKAD
jgi:tripartite-type tricarboxylate transporter receptor subunit TctC